MPTSDQAPPEDRVEFIARVSSSGVLLALEYVHAEAHLLPADMAVGQNVSQMSPPALRRQGMALITTALARQQSQRFRGPFPGTDRTVEFEIVPAGANEVLAIVRDITARLASEERLLQLNRTLLSLQSAATAVTASLEMEHILESLAWELTNLLRAEACLVSLGGANDPVLTLAAAHPDATLARSALNGDRPVRPADYPLTRLALTERYVRQVTLDPGQASLPEQAYLRQTGCGGLLMIPMTNADQTIGLVELLQRSPEPFSEHLVSLAQLLTNEAAGALVNARLFQESQRRLREQTALRQASATIASTLDLPTVLSVMAEQMCQALDMTSVRIFQTDAAAAAMEVAAHHAAVAAAPLERPARLGVRYEMIPELQDLLQATKPVPRIWRADDTGLSTAMQAHLALFGSQTVVVLPMQMAGKVIALAELRESRARQPLNAEEIGLAESLAQQAAVALEHARLYQELAQRLQELATLNRITQVIPSTLDLQDTMGIITDGIRDLMGIEAVSVALVEEQASHFAYVAATGGAAAFITGRRLAWGQGIVGDVLQRGEPALVHNVRTDPRHYTQFDQDSGFRTRSMLCVPLVAKRQTIGAISAMNKLQGDFNDRDLELLTSLAAPAAAAIDNARLYQRARQEIADRQQAEAALEEERALLAQRVAERTAALEIQVQRQRALAAIDPGVNVPDDLRVVLQHIADLAETTLQLDGGAQILLQAHEEESRPLAFSSPEVPAMCRPDHASFPVPLWSQLNQPHLQAVTSDHLPPEWTAAGAWLAQAGVAGVTTMPLLSQGRHHGVICAWTRRPRELAQDDLDFLTALTNRAAVALANVQLYEAMQQANAELARVARMKDEFLASMSHELRTPLNAILGIAEALQEQYYGPLNQQQMRSAHIVEESGRHLLALINDILDVSKIESGQLQLEIEAVPIQAICHTSLQFVRQSAARKNITLSQDIDGEVRLVQADARRLKQILINLLSNAVKFTPAQGRVGLEVRGNVAEELVDIAVWDTGIGIAAEDLPRLFQPFVQLDSALSRRYAGTGLGLALVKRMTEMLQGRVSVTSRLGEGSRFTVTLPWTPQDTQPAPGHNVVAPATAVPAPNGTVSPPAAGRLPILLADDDPFNAEIFAEMLEMDGYRVRVARTGHEVLAQCRAERPALVLMDLQMPDMDGLEATRRLRAIPELASMPIIALTALAMPDDEARCLAAGANAYLSKPVPLQTLKRTIREYLHEPSHHARQN